MALSAEATRASRSALGKSRVERDSESVRVACRGSRRLRAAGALRGAFGSPGLRSHGLGRAAVLWNDSAGRAFAALRPDGARPARRTLRLALPRNGGGNQVGCLLTRANFRGQLDCWGGARALVPVHQKVSPSAAEDLIPWGRKCERDTHAPSACLCPPAWRSGAAVEGLRLSLPSGAQNSSQRRPCTSVDCRASESYAAISPPSHPKRGIKAWKCS